MWMDGWMNGYMDGWVDMQLGGGKLFILSFYFFYRWYQFVFNKFIYIFCIFVVENEYFINLGSIWVQVEVFKNMKYELVRYLDFIRKQVQF